MLPLLIGALAGAGLGGVKSIAQGGQESADRRLAAETQRFSPWTNLIAQAPKRTDVFGNLFSGAVGGAMQGQNVGQYLKGLPTPEVASAAATSGPQSMLGMPKLQGSSWSQLTQGAAPHPRPSLAQLQKVAPQYGGQGLGLGQGKLKGLSWEDLLQLQYPERGANDNSSFGGWG